MMRPCVLKTLVLVAGLASPFLGCRAQSRPCVTTDACSSGQLCMAGSCQPKNQLPTPPSSRRLMLEPQDLALVSSAQGLGTLPAYVPFGRHGQGQTVLLLRFASPFNESSRISSAVLVLQPMSEAPQPSHPIELGLSRVLAPWTSQQISWGTLPKLSPVESHWYASPWGGRPLYINVTAQVQRWGQHRAEEQGLALVASPQDPVGAWFALGLAGGPSPRLDVYLR